MENNENILQEDNQVLVDKSLLQNLIDEVRALKEGKPTVLKEIKEHKAFMRKVDGKYVIGFTKPNWIEYFGPKNEEKMYCEVVLSDENGKNSKKKIEYIELLHSSEKVEVIIKKTIPAEEIKEDGVVEVQKVNEYHTEGTGVYVPLRVISINYESEILTPEGNLMTVDNKILNI
jgi:hypothetical protein